MARMAHSIQTKSVASCARVTPRNSRASVHTAAHGEIVALCGDNIGPASIVKLQVNNGTVTNSLVGTQVMFDGVAAPMIYTLKTQLSAVVPYAVAGKTSTQVQVKYQDG